MDYSYYPSGLNLTIYLAKSPNQFATELPSLLQVKWYSTCLLELNNLSIIKPQTELPISIHFILLS